MKNVDKAIKNLLIIYTNTIQQKKNNDKKQVTFWMF